MSNTLQHRLGIDNPPGSIRVADGVPARHDRCRVLGNAVVPQIAEFIGEQVLSAEQRNI